MEAALAPDVVPLPRREVERALHWVSWFRDDWQGETPINIHRRAVDDGHGLGGLAFTGEFVQWIGDICHCGGDSCRFERPRRNTDSRLRTTRAFRKLRKTAPREFDVLYMLCALSMDIYAVRDALNERAERLGKPERYGTPGVLILVVSGVDKLLKLWDK